MLQTCFKISEIQLWTTLMKKIVAIIIEPSDDVKVKHPCLNIYLYHILIPSLIKKLSFNVKMMDDNNIQLKSVTMTFQDVIQEIKTESKSWLITNTTELYSEDYHVHNTAHVNFSLSAQARVLENWNWCCYSCSY